MARLNQWRQLSDTQKDAIQKHQSNGYVPVCAIAQSLGISIKVSNMGPNNSGQILRNPDGDGYLIKINREAKKFQRFTIAHALAHFFLHRELIDSTPEGIINNVLYRTGPPSEIEYVVNRLTSDILMPYESIQQKLCLLGCREKDTVSDLVIKTLAREFKVSHTVMKIRLQIVAALDR